jgi:hypothetical protein
MTIIIIKFYLILTLLFNGYDKRESNNNPVKDINSVSFQGDVKGNNIIPGVKHYEYSRSEYPWVINVLEVDMTRKNLVFEAVKSNDMLFGGREKTTSMVNRRIEEKYNVIGAINADFFDMDNGNINNIQITNGKFIRGINTRKSLVVFTYNNDPYIDKFRFTGKVIQKKSKSLDINAINFRRGKDSLVLYNSFWGKSTLTKGTGKEITIRPVEEWKVNDTFKVVVISSSDSNTVLSNDIAVLSGDGSSGELLNSQAGDTLSLYLGTNPRIEKIKEALGGLPQIIKNGIDISETQTIKEGSSAKFITTRHPRTAIGYNKDKTKLYLLVVDGRQAKSVGMQLTELAQFMISIGCWDALNLDGGGSTTMLVRDKIVNSPSDLIGERAVGNALLLYTK